MRIKTALIELYQALGGSSDLSEKKNGEIIDATAGVVSAGTFGDLPAVSDTDNGKVLKVADGKWAVGTDLTE